MKIIAFKNIEELQLSEHSSDLIPSMEIYPETAIIRKGNPFFVPIWGSEWAFNVSIAVTIERLGKGIYSQFAHRYWSERMIALHAVPGNAELTGAAFTAFDNCLLIGGGLCNSDKSTCRYEAMRLYDVNGTSEVIDFQISCSDGLIDAAVSSASQFFTLHTGDVILLQPVNKISLPIIKDTKIIVSFNNEQLLFLRIK